MGYISNSTNAMWKQYARTHSARGRRNAAGESALERERERASGCCKNVFAKVKAILKATFRW